MPIADTRAMVKAALDGGLSQVEYEEDPYFGLQGPKHCPDVDPKLLQPKATWDDPDAYDRKAAEVANAFASNFDKIKAEDTSNLAAVGPRGR